MSNDWNKGVSLAMGGPGELTTISNNQEASWALIEDWPLEDGDALDAALLTLEAAMKGKKSAEAARLSFIAAAHEAGIEIKD